MVYRGMRGGGKASRHAVAAEGAPSRRGVWGNFPNQPDDPVRKTTRCKRPHPKLQFRHTSELRWVRDCVPARGRGGRGVPHNQPPACRESPRNRPAGVAEGLTVRKNQVTIKKTDIVRIVPGVGNVPADRRPAAHQERRSGAPRTEFCQLYFFRKQRTGGPGSIGPESEAEAAL